MASDPARAPATIAQTLRQVNAELSAVGIDEASLDARRLLASALDATPATLIRDPSRVLTADEQARLAHLVSRRLSREPVSRILGTREFYGRPFKLTPDVLDPRADTETLIDVALAIGREAGWLDRPVRIADLGTGSGAILLTLLAEWPLASGVGIDISTAALDCAALNAASLGVGDRAAFKQADILSGLSNRFDLVISNPPYIPSADIAGLAPEVRDFDPRLALDGRADGLAYYRSILADWAATTDVVDEPRFLLLEIGANQASRVAEIAQNTGAYQAKADISFHRDLGGHVRCVAIKARPTSG